MNYKLSIYIAIIGLVFVQCSKKAVDQVQGPVDQSWRNNTPVPSAARSIKIADYQTFNLDNGLKVIVVENHKLPIVSYQVSLKTEAVFEKEKMGFISMAGSLISTGTDKRNKAELDKAIDFIGATINTSGLGVFGSSLLKHQGTLLDIMTEMLYGPSFPQEEFDKLKTQTLSGLQASKADPISIAGNVASVVNFGTDHPFGEVQTESTIANITVEDCKEYFQNYFRPNNAYLIIVGDISLEEAKINVQKHFSSWKAGSPTQSSFSNPQPPLENKVSFANKDGAVQSVIRITHPLQLKPGSEDVVKVSVMNEILGGGVFLGRLMQNLREDKAYTYSSRSSIRSNPIVATFNASASVRNEVVDSAIVEFLYEINRMKTEAVTVKDLQLAKNSLAGNFARALESPQTIARFARNTFHYQLPDDYYSTYLSRLDAVTVEDVQMMSNKYLRPEKTNIVVVGNKDEVAERLIPFDSDGEVDFYNAFGELVQNSENSIPEGVTAETIINDYIDAIGGKEALNNIKTVNNEMKMSVMGQEATVMLYQKSPDKLSLTISLQGMTLQEQKFDGNKALNATMGQKKITTEGKEFDSLKDQAMIFPQLEYKSDQLDLKGIEEIDGKKLYKIEVTKSSGKKELEYYDVLTNLLVKTSSVQEGPGGQEITTFSDIQDYKSISGVLFPHKLTISGAAPQPLTMESINMVINEPIDDSVFEIKE